MEPEEYGSPKITNSGSTAICEVVIPILRFCGFAVLRFCGFAVLRFKLKSLFKSVSSSRYSYVLDLTIFPSLFRFRSGFSLNCADVESQGFSRRDMRRHGLGARRSRAKQRFADPSVRKSEHG